MFQLCMLIRNKCNVICQLYAKFQLSVIICMYGSRAVTLLVLISDDVINRILKLDIQTNILVYVTRCCTDLTSKVLKERTFGQSSAVLTVLHIIQ